MNTVLKISYVVLLAGLASSSLSAAKPKEDSKKIEEKKIASVGVSALKEVNVEEFNHKGPLSLERSKINQAEVYGPTNLQKTQITKEIKVIGPLTAKECEFNALEVKGPCKIKKSAINDFSAIGPVKLDETTLNDKISVVGPLKSENSTFKKDVEVNGPFIADESKFEGKILITLNNYNKGKHYKKRIRPAASFDESTAGEVTIKGVAGEERPVKVVVKNGSKIEKITFIDIKNGSVDKDGKSTVGEIIGGELAPHSKSAELNKSDD